jgi:DNA-binding response OmpR family regulator
VKLRILVVEDEKLISEPLAEGLGREGFDTEIVANHESARQGWRRSPDLIWSTSCFPTATGNEDHDNSGSGSGDDD